MDSNVLDQLTVEGKKYIYLDGAWTTPAGYRVPTAYGQSLTMTFYERAGRGPISPKEELPPPAPKGRAAKAALVQATAVISVPSVGAPAGPQKPGVSRIKAAMQRVNPAPAAAPMARRARAPRALA